MTFVLLYSLAQVVNAQPDSTIIKGAMAEGKLTWYSSTVLDANMRIIYEFEARYPFIEVERVGKMGSTKIKQEFESQIRSNNVKVDVIHLAMPTAIMNWKNKGYLMYYDSDFYDAYPPNAKDEGWWAAARNITVCIGYNSNTLSAKNAPKTWLELIDVNKSQNWAGKLMVGNPQIYATRLVQYYALRELYGPEYWQKIADLTVKVESGPGQVRNFFEDEETIVSVSYLGYFYDEQAIKKGKPIRAVWPSDGVPIVPCPIAITKDAPHPNAAKLFMEYILSQEGQALFQVLAGDYSMRDDVPPMPGKRPIKDLNIIKIDWEKFEKKKSECIMEFQQFFKKQLDKALLESTSK